MTSKKAVYAIAILLAFSISVCVLPQFSAPYGAAQAPPQASSITRQADPPSSYTRLIREYLLPETSLAVPTFVPLSRGPYGIAYDNTGYTWVTDFTRDAIYRLTPATLLNQTATTASEWILPNTMGRRFPSYIIVDESHKVVWFTDPASKQISRLNWTTNIIDDWNLVNLNIMPLDLVMESSDEIWFTALNETRFFQLNVATNSLTAYTIGVGAPLARPTKIAINATCLFLTDWKYDRLYEVPLAAPVTAFTFPLTTPGWSWDVDVDVDNNAWVTQPLSSLIDEQLAGSTAKYLLQIVESSPFPVVPIPSNTTKNTLNVDIVVTPVTPSVFPGPLNVTGDPIVVWSVPSDVTPVTYQAPPARPWEIATSSDGYAWYTEPIQNHIGVVMPDTNTTLLYPVPTTPSWTVCIDIQPDQGLNPYHVWFTEYRSANIGELFYANFTDLRVCPSLGAQYPPPSPGSIRWDNYQEIWFDAPSNGFDPSHRDTPDMGATNHLYAKVRNLGSVASGSISVKFYWYNDTFATIASNYIPLPPGAPSASKWVYIGTATVTSLSAGSTVDVYVDFYFGSDIPSYASVVGVQVSVGGDINLYDNVGYRNFTRASPPPPPLFTVPGIAVGFATGLGLMAVVALVLRKK